MIHLRSFHFQPWPERLAVSYPHSLPLFGALQEMVFESPVTIFVGENGSGKSTLLEGLACAADLPVVGGESLRTDPSLAPARSLAKYLRLAWQARKHRGFFLRAEDFFNYIRTMARTREELQRDLEDIDQTYQGRSQTAIDYARMPYQSELDAIQRRYGQGLEAASHGESFLNLFQARFVPGGLYLLDEPEAPLSPLRQLGLLSLLKNMVGEGESQFIIATHSPLLMAFPEAQIVSFDSLPPQTVAYQDLEHVNLTRDFLQNPEAFLKHL